MHTRTESSAPLAPAEATPAAPPSAHDASRLLAELLAREHVAMADFLVALAEFDRQTHWAELGYPTLFDYLVRELRLSGGAAQYRKIAARLLQRFPDLAEPLRDGRLCLTVVAEVARVLTPENREELLPRFFGRSRREAKVLAMEVSPSSVIPRREVITVPDAPLPGRTNFQPVESLSPPPATNGAAPDAEPENLPTRGVPHPVLERTPRLLHAAVVVEPMSSDLRRLHVTVSRTLLEKLERARAGQSHVKPGASTEDVLDAALDLLLAAQERRRATVPPRVKRAVWKRDGGRCTWPTKDGGTCGSTVLLQVDHIVPRARGGPSTVENCRLLCAAHNRLAARQVFGDSWMDRFKPARA